MKKLVCFIVALTVVAFFLTLSSCKDKIVEKHTFTANVPKYMSKEVMRKSVKVTSAETIETPGKIYLKNNYIFINEFLKGVHVFDNTNPENPVNVAFIEIPGNIDIAIFNNYLYADSYVDLVIFDISDINNIKEVNRVKEVFPTLVAEFDRSYPSAPVDTSKGVVCSWEVKDYTEEYKVETQQGVYRWNGEFYMDGNSKADVVSMPTSAMQAGNSTGVGGSLARFMLYKNYFYVLNNWNLLVFDISNPKSPVRISQVATTWNAETLFTYKDRMFVGTQTGMLIYDLAEPRTPAYLSAVWHAQGCDPVVVDDNYAYITVRSGNICGQNLSELDIVDISTITAPKFIKSYPMEEPYGLGISGNTLFLCDGSAGLKVFDVTDKLAIDQHLLQQFKNVEAIDVIPLHNNLMTIARNGFYQYDYSNPAELKFLSKIAISQ